MILITGASGNVGSEVLKQAMAAKLKLTAAYQSAEKAQTAPGNVHTVVLDYDKRETIRTALEGVDTLFLVGPPTANLVALEANVIDEAQTAGITHLVKLSALGGAQGDLPVHAPRFGRENRSFWCALYIHAAEWLYAELRDLQLGNDQGAECFLRLSGKWGGESHRCSRRCRCRDCGDFE